MSKEYPCVYHENGECKKFSGDGITSYCVLGPCPDEAQSNADRIRAMSDGELAEWINRLLILDGPDFCQNKTECKAMLEEDVDMPEENCIRCLVDWLRRPAEGGEQDGTV